MCITPHPCFISVLASLIFMLTQQLNLHSDTSPYVFEREPRWYLAWTNLSFFGLTFNLVINTIGACRPGHTRALPRLFRNMRTLITRTGCDDTWHALRLASFRSGTWTLKLCRRGEPGIFCHVKSAKGREDLIVRGHTRNSEQEKERRYRTTYYTYLAIGRRISYTPSVEA